MAAIGRLLLLNNAAVTGAYVNVPISGTYLVMAIATFGGATIALQMLGPDDTTAVAISGASFTAAGHALVNLAAGMQVRAAVTSGPPSAAYVSMDLVLK